MALSEKGMKQFADASALLCQPFLLPVVLFLQDFCQFTRNQNASDLAVCTQSMPPITISGSCTL